MNEAPSFPEKNRYVALADTGNEQVCVSAKIERDDIKSGADQFTRDMAPAGRGLENPVGDRHRSQ